MTTTNTNLSFSSADLAHINMWGAGSALGGSWNWELGDTYNKAGTIDTAALDLDYSITAGAAIGANFTATSGYVDVGCNVVVNATLPNVVRCGEYFVIDTSNYSVGSSSLTSTSPSISAEIYADLSANASLSNISVGGLLSIDPLNYTYNNHVTLLDITQAYPDATFTAGPFTVGGHLPVINAAGTGYATVTAKDQSDLPILQSTADLDRLVALAASKIPATAAPALAYLGGDPSGSKDILEGTWGSSDGVHVDYTLFDAELSAGLYAIQTFTFTVTSIGVTMVSDYNGETRTGELGDAFIFSTPTTGTGTIAVNATYSLNGTLTNDTGVVGNCTLDLSALQFDLLGTGVGLDTSLPGFSASLGKNSYTNPFSLYNNTQALTAIDTTTSSYTVNYSATAASGSTGTTATISSAAQASFSGTSGADTLYGNDLDNLMQGFDGNDRIYAGAGNDTIDAGTGSDAVYAGSGNDTITVVAETNKSDTVSGGAGTDTLIVDATANGIGSIDWGTTTAGISGCNYSSSMAAIQTFLGAAVTLKLGRGGHGVTFDGIENLSITASADGYSDLLIVRGTGSYDGKGGTDTLYADWSAATQGIAWNNAANATPQTVNGSSIAGIERLLITTGSGADSISNTDFDTNDEIVTGVGNDTINAGNGSDRVDAGSGNDTITVVAETNKSDTVSGGAGTDTLIVDATANGIGSIDWGTTTAGISGCNYSSSMAAIQTFLGAAVTLKLGRGGHGVTFDGIENLSITASADGYSDLLIVRGTGSYDGKGGTDTLYADWSTATSNIIWDNAPSATEVIDSVTVAKTQTVNGIKVTNMERLLLQTGSGNDILSNTTVSTNDEFVTGAGNDAIAAGDGNDYIDGGSGGDQLNGGTGVDTLIGGTGNDTLTGGDGNDTAVFYGSFADYGITYNPSTTILTVTDKAPALNGDDGVDTISGVESFKFDSTVKTLAEMIAAATTATADTAAPIISSLSPADNATGVAPSANWVLSFNEAIKAGTGNFTLYNTNGTVAKTIAVTDASQVSISGSSVTLNPSADLAAGSGYYINAAAGVIKDLAGNSFAGITGTAAYNFTTATITPTNIIPTNNSFALTTPTAINYTDTVFDDSFATVTASLAATDSNFLTYDIIGGTNNGNGTVSKNSAYGVLTLTKATGAYSFAANDSAIELLATNTSVSFTVTASDGALTDSKPLTVNITQNGTTESSGNDTLVGTTGNDMFDGLAGNDIIDGNAGADTMVGDLGNDIYFVDDANDVVTETSALKKGGIDTVNSSVSYTLGDNLEILTLTGTAAINGTGNALKNILTGNTGANILNGGLGADRLIGDTGNDSYYVDNVGDVVIETSTLESEIDTVNSSINYLLLANLENLALTGTAAIKGKGNALNNVLTGNTSANKLDGGAGADTLIGSLGKDTLAGGLDADTFSFNAEAETGISASTRDIIVDFNHSQGDKIDLSAIDANTANAEDDAFLAPTIGGIFSGSFANPGELYFDKAKHILYGNNDADSAADFSIQLTGVSSLVDADFVL
jgi:Ca2+-binding RTX toxin-like protein